MIINARALSGYYPCASDTAGGGHTVAALWLNGPTVLLSAVSQALHAAPTRSVDT